MFIAGLVVLVIGAELLVRGAARLAAGFGIAPLVIGLTVVAFGTSAPELVVSTVSAYNGTAEIAIGNVVGSNIFNVLFILGLSAVVAPLIVSRQLIREDVPIMIGVSVIMYIMALDHELDRWEGVMLAGGLIYYTYRLIRKSKMESNDASKEFEAEFGKVEAITITFWFKNTGFLVAGLVLLILGSDWLVDSCVAIAQAMGVSNLVIGLTIVAAGTSLPEVATSVVASIKGERDIAVGNVVGSNIFNILSVLGFSSILAPTEIPVSQAALDFDIPVMIAVAVACLPIFFHGSQISRWEGFLLLGYYVAYTAYLVMASTKHEGLDAFSDAMLFIVLPLTIVTLVVITVQELRKRGNAVSGK
jgi:cation:H+ antiporter